MVWTEERVNTLKSMWMQGYSARQIAEKLGNVTRNAVIGKAHRMGLSSRSMPTVSHKALDDTAPAVRTCQWPIGHPGQKGFHFCGLPCEIGKSYCATHCEIAYRRVSQNESAA